MGFDASNMIAGLNRAKALIDEALVDGVNEVAELVRGDAWEICPQSPTDKNHKEYTGTSGSLRNSLTAEPAEVEGNLITAIIGSNVNYAAAVHERDATHNYPGTGNPIGQWKYLATPMKAWESKFAPYIAQKVKEVLGA